MPHPPLTFRQYSPAEARRVRLNVQRFPTHFLKTPPMERVQASFDEGFSIGAARAGGTRIISNVCGYLHIPPARDGCQCFEVGSVFSRVGGYGLMVVNTGLVIVNFVMLNRDDIPIIAVVARTNEISRKQLEKIGFSLASPALVKSLRMTRPLSKNTLMMEFDRAKLISIIDFLFKSHRSNVLVRSSKPRRKLIIDFDLPLLNQFRPQLEEFRDQLCKKDCMDTACIKSCLRRAA